MNNKIPEYEIKYSKIENIYIQIKNGKITVKAPKRVSKKEIEKIEEMIDFEDWQKTDQTTYFEFFKLNRMGDYLNKEQRQRILDVARVMFPNAEKGLYTEEITQRQKEEP